MPCSGNPILLLSVSASFAAPLLLKAKQQSAGGGGIHLIGKSSNGKTTALQVAASVWGGPGYVRAWRATANGLEATAAALNDSLIVLDEISECDPREIGAIIYALANGQGKQGQNGMVEPVILSDGALSFYLVESVLYQHICKKLGSELKLDKKQGC